MSLLVTSVRHLRSEEMDVLERYLISCSTSEVMAL